MHPKTYAQTTPDKAAYIMAGSGETVTYRELDQRSNQGAHLFRSLGLKPGDVIAICMDNHPRYFEIAWAAQRSGLYYTCISSKLTAGEIEYIMGDCGAQALIVSPGIGSVIDELPGVLKGAKLYIVGGARPAYESFEAARGAFPTTPIADETAGSDMLYSSGTTGRPKGIKPPLTGGPIDDQPGMGGLATQLFNFPGQDSIYLSPAPLYHAAPLRWTMGDLRVLRRHRGQRLLLHQLPGLAGPQGLGRPGADRRAEDLRRGRRGAAPAHRRGGPLRGRSAAQLPQRPGEGRRGHQQVRLDDAGRCVAARGGIMQFVGAPHEEMGEQVVAVIQPAHWGDAGDDLRDELMAYARANLSHVKAPRKLDFMEELPRHPTGKLYKRLIRDSYWGKTDAKIV